MLDTGIESPATSSASIPIPETSQDTGEAGHSQHAERPFDHRPPSPVNDIAAGQRTDVDQAAPAARQGEEEAVQSICDTRANTDRFASPLIAEILETWRARQDMVRAQTKLTLQMKAICRRFTAGDKKEADKLYAAVIKGTEHPQADRAGIAVLALRGAVQPLEATRKDYEKHLTKLGAGLPIAYMAERIRGVSTLTLAVIVGECGDLSAYEKGVAGIWKRAGLAVIDGERQRRKSGDAALLHGYSRSAGLCSGISATRCSRPRGKTRRRCPTG